MVAGEGQGAPGARRAPPGSSVGEWTDSHCHVQAGYLPGDRLLDEVLVRATAAGVGRLVCVGTDLVTSKQAVGLAADLVARGDGRLPQAWSTVGLHPHEARAGTGPVEELLVTLLGGAGDVGGAGGERESEGRPAGSVIAVGECGLDYHYDHSPRADQRRAFEEQIELAKRLGLAVVVHTREAWDDTVAMLAEHAPLPRTIVHCFTGGPEEAERCLALGAYLSFSGIVTFKTANDVREAARMCPEDRLLVETDAPFLAPVPHRGKPNEPAYVALVGAALAAVREVDAGELAASSTAAATEAMRLG